MEIAINHLTRMKHPHICVAGVARSDEHVRPVLPFTDQLHRSLLTARHGAFSLGSVMELGPTTPSPEGAQVENAVFDPDLARTVRNLDGDGFLKVLEFVAKSSLGDVFGPDLEAASRTAASVPEGEGNASLGVLGPLRQVWVKAREEQRGHAIRCQFVDPDLGYLSLKVTDIRLWEPDHITPLESAIRAIESLLQGCYISVGLTRPWPPDGPRHWVQVNNIFPVDNPLWACA